MMTFRDFSVELIQSEMLLGVFGEQGQPSHGMSLLPKFVCNVHGHSRTTLPGVEIVQVHGARGLPAVCRVVIQHPSALADEIEVVCSLNELRHGLPTDGLQGGAHPPIGTVVFPSTQKVNVLCFHGADSMQIGG